MASSLAPSAANPSQWLRKDGGPEQCHHHACAVPSSSGTAFILTKRQNYPNFKKRLREQRKKQKFAKERAGISKLPDLKGAEVVQKFFLEEIQLGEELLAQGDYEKGKIISPMQLCCVDSHRSYCVTANTPTASVPDASKLPIISHRIVSAQSLAEDDVE